MVWKLLNRGVSTHSTHLLKVLQLPVCSLGPLESHAARLVAALQVAAEAASEVASVDEALAKATPSIAPDVAQALAHEEVLLPSEERQGTVNATWFRRCS